MDVIEYMIVIEDTPAKEELKHMVQELTEARKKIHESRLYKKPNIDIYRMCELKNVRG
jgi:hypothetical protein